MALSDLNTDLTSLKYGGSKPVIRHKMGNKVSQVSARIDDVKRLAGILTRAPGIKFAGNQALLAKAKIGSAFGNKLASGGSIAGAGFDRGGALAGAAAGGSAATGGSLAGGVSGERKKIERKYDPYDW